MILLYLYRALLPALTAMVLFLAGVLYCCSRAEAQTPGGGPAAVSLLFRLGERQVYELRWGVIPAGFAELALLPPTDLAGVLAYHFQLSILTNDFGDVFYKVRDNIEFFNGTQRELPGGYSPLMD